MQANSRFQDFQEVNNVPAVAETQKTEMSDCRVHRKRSENEIYAADTRGPTAKQQHDGPDVTVKTAHQESGPLKRT